MKSKPAPTEKKSVMGLDTEAPIVTPIQTWKMRRSAFRYTMKNGAKNITLGVESTGKRSIGPEDERRGLYMLKK